MTFGLLGLFLLILTQTLRPLARLVFENQDGKVEVEKGPTDDSLADASLVDPSPADVGKATDPGMNGVPTVPDVPPSDLPESGAPLPANVAQESGSPSSPVTPVPAATVAVTPKPEMVPGPATESVPPATIQPNPSMPLEPDVVVAGEVGSLVTDDSLLLLKDATSGAWMRVAKGATVASPALLVSLPAQRNRMLLAGGIDLTIYGSTSVTTSVLKGRPIPRISLDYGRIVLGTTKAEAMTPLVLHGIEGNLRLADLRSLVAIEVRMEHRRGMDPEAAGSTSSRVLISALQGEVAWESAQGQSQVIEVGQQLSFVDGAMTGVGAPESPLEWIDAPPPPPTSLEHIAKAGLWEFMLASDVPADLALRDATNHRRSEVVALAAQSLLLVGGADMMFGSDGLLNRATQRAYWTQHFEALQSAISRGPEYALQVHRAIEQMSAVESQVLYRMLWGFSNEQLAAGDDERLVQWLDHPSMSVRVLAIENLKEITATPQGLGYRADVESRRPEVQKWLGKMRRGEIRHP